VNLTTPVALIIFNRPDLTEQVFQSIRQAQPRQLLVIADGPRIDERPGEAEKCAAARAVIDQVDWDCEVLTNYSDVNLGCKYRVSSGIDWVFSKVEEAIILEDDCLPTLSFFFFCQTLLEYYRDDERVMHIAGTNHQDGQFRCEYSYIFSKMAHIWGWATWRRAWKHYDIEMKTWPEFKKSKMLKFISENKYEIKYWTDIFDVMNSPVPIDTWDYMWVYACFSQSGLGILPSSNLISNIGFREDATHTKDLSSQAELPTIDIWDIKHPPFVIRNKTADTYTFDYEYGGISMRKQDTWQFKARKKLSVVKQLLDFRKFFK
jgi:hypothetical protein